jgi:hypothetical protein
VVELVEVNRFPREKDSLTALVFFFSRGVDEGAYCAPQSSKGERARGIMSQVLRVSKTIPAAMDLLQNRRDRRSSGKGGCVGVVLFSDGSSDGLQEADRGK